MPRTSATRKGNGPGWGGPAKGAAVERGEPVPFAPGNTMGALPPRPDKAARRERMLEVYAEVAEQTEHPMARIAAATAWLNRVEGLPIARSINVEADDLAAFDDAAIRRERAELDALHAAAEGGKAPADS